MVPASVTSFLESHGVAYTAYPHDWAGSARDFGVEMGVSDYHPVQVFPFRTGRDGPLFLAAMEATSELDCDKLAKVLGAREVTQVAHPRALFGDCDPAALPPFGALFDARVVMDLQLATANDFVFRAGTKEDAIEMRAGDYFRIEHPFIAAFASPATAVADRISEAMDSVRVGTSSGRWWVSSGDDRHPHRS